VVFYVQDERYDALTLQVKGCAGAAIYMDVMYDALTLQVKGCAGAAIYRDVMATIVPDNFVAFPPSMAVATIVPDSTFFSKEDISTIHGGRNNCSRQYFLQQRRHFHHPWRSQQLFQTVLSSAEKAFPPSMAVAAIVPDNTFLQQRRHFHHPWRSQQLFQTMLFFSKEDISTIHGSHSNCSRQYFSSAEKTFPPSMAV
jgi:hypothetical protein